MNNAGGAYTLAANEFFAIRVSRTGEALVVFMGNVNPVSEWKDNWAYVYNTKVAQNGDAYLVSAIINGKDGTYMVEQAYAADGTTELILPDKLASGIYKHTITEGLYNYTVDGDIYTLTQKHLTAGYNAAGVVSGFRSSYIRVGNFSYTITDKTQMFEARKNETVNAITSVNQGDEVVVVYNDDNEAVYVFLTKYSYESDSSSTPGAGTSETTVGNITFVAPSSFKGFAATVSGGNLVFQFNPDMGAASAANYNFKYTVTKNGVEFSSGTQSAAGTNTASKVIVTDTGAYSADDKLTVTITDVVPSAYTMTGADSNVTVTNGATAGLTTTVTALTDNDETGNKTVSSAPFNNSTPYVAAGPVTVTVTISDVKTNYTFNSVVADSALSGTWTYGTKSAGSSIAVDSTGTFTSDLAATGISALSGPGTATLTVLSGADLVGTYTLDLARGATSATFANGS